jgi:Fe-S-cluster containining protein
MKISSGLNKLNEEVLDLFAEVDKRAKEFKDLTGLNCIEECGHCCLKKDIEATILEFLPLSIHLWKKGEAGAWLDKILGSGTEGVCVFYRPDPGIQNNGRCGIYSHRGLICRVFGVFGARDKKGAPGLTVCSVIRKNLPKEVKKAEKAIGSGAGIPLMTEYSSRLAAIDPALGSRFYPINVAIRYAIEKVGFGIELAEKAA